MKDLLAFFPHAGSLYRKHKWGKRTGRAWLDSTVLVQRRFPPSPSRLTHCCSAILRSCRWCSRAASASPSSSRALPMQEWRLAVNSGLLGRSLSERERTVRITCSACFRLDSALPLASAVCVCVHVCACEYVQCIVHRIFYSLAGIIYSGRWSPLCVLYYNTLTECLPQHCLLLSISSRALSTYLVWSPAVEPVKTSQGYILCRHV